MSVEQGVVRSTRLIAALTLLSRLLGLARETTFALFFGTGELLSAYRIAFMVPNLARRLFGEGALSSAFIPIFTRSLQDPDPSRPRRLAGGLLTLLTIILLALVVVIEAGLLVAEAISPAVTLRLTALMLPFMALICVAAFLGGVLNALERFAAPAAAPIILNVVVIAATFGGARLAGLEGLALIYVTCGAVLVAGILQVVSQMLSLRRVGFIPRLSLDWRQPEIAEVFRLMLPMIVGLSTVQINTLGDMLIAFLFVPDGRGPAVLGFAQTLYQLPLGVFGIALATAIFPLLSRQAAAGDLGGVARTVESGARFNFFIALPSAVGLIVLAEPIVAVLFEGGEFSAGDTQRVATVLTFFSLGLVSYSMQHVLVRAFHALKDSGTPSRVSMTMVACNLALNLLLVHPFGESGVALSTAVTALAQNVWLTRLLRRRLPSLDGRSVAVSMLKTAAATAVMGLCLWALVGEASPVAVSGWSAAMKVAVAVPVGAVLLGLTARLLAIPELAALLGRG